jgi:putative oxygen-independent coproporphyrinogen III oxidase
MWVGCSNETSPRGLRLRLPVTRVTHLYVHVPFCAHRCGYCDFVTVTGHADRHAAYIDAVLAELELERAWLGEPLETIFLGGGTPTLIGPVLLERLLAGLPPAAEVTVEANPETVDDALAELLARRGVRVSLGAQSFGARELEVLERRATPDTVRDAVATLRRAGVANLNLDVLFGIPGETPEALDRDIDEVLRLGPDHVSCYELEAKPGTRFTFTHGAELLRQADLLEDHYEHVIERLEGAGYRWYETANFCREDRRCRHNLAIWRGEEYLGIGVGAVSTLGLTRRRNGPRLAPYLDALARGEAPLRQEEQLTPDERLHERILLGLRLDEPLATAPLRDGLDGDEVERLAALGMVETGAGTLTLTRRGRMVANDVISRLITD